LTLLGILGLGLVLFFFGLILLFAFLIRRGRSPALRSIPAFDRLQKAIGRAVEAGNRLHVSIGSGEITGPQAAVALVGLTILNRIARDTTISDRPPVATSGQGSLAILTQDVMRSSAREIGAEYSPLSGRLTGVTPFSYAAGAMAVVQDEDVGASILIGSFGPEVALINEIGERTGGMTLAGTDNLPGQAVIYATAQEPLIGEETFAGGAYLDAGPVHTASLRAEDWLRWLIIASLLLGAVAKFFGFL